MPIAVRYLQYKGIFKLAGQALAIPLRVWHEVKERSSSQAQQARLQACESPGKAHALWLRGHIWEVMTGQLQCSKGCGSYWCNCRRHVQYACLGENDKVLPEVLLLLTRNSGSAFKGCSAQGEAKVL